MKKLILSLAIAFAPLTSQAAVCITGISQSTQTTFTANFLTNYALTCRELETWQTGMRVASYTFNVASLALACTAVGTPVSVGIFGVGTLILTADLIVSSLPCEDDTAEKTEKLIRNEVCLALEAQGLECNPNTIQRN